MSGSPSERIKLIKAAALILSGESWASVDLTLEAFGLPTANEFSGSQEEYVIAHLKTAPITALRELVRHLSPDNPLIQPSPLDASSVMQSEPASSSLWPSGHFRLFISHLSAHKEYAHELKASLAGNGITGFVAHDDIEPTADWLQTIKDALSTCDALVALLHPDFHRSHWTDHEIGFVLGRSKPAFSVRLGQDPYGLIGSLQAFPGVGRTAAQVADLLVVGLYKHESTSERASLALVERFKASSSFAMAKKLMDQIEAHIPPTLTIGGVLEEAVQANDQVRSSWGVHERVKAFLSRAAPH